MRARALPLLLATALALPAQEDLNGNRLGVGLAFLAPTGTWSNAYNSGFQAGLQIHFNRESRHLGRLRIDYLAADSNNPLQEPGYYLWSKARMEAYSIAYEWMPHLENHSRSGLFGIFGMGGTLWNETFRNATYSGGSRTDSDWGFTLSAGLGWRFNPHATLEGRFINSDMAFQGHHHYGTQRAAVTLGTSFRF
jgi:hypothetical protein